MIITIYNHEYGNTVKAFSELKYAYEWMDEIANDYWENAFTIDIIKPDTEQGKAYFLLMDDYSGYNESFQIIENISIEK